MKIEDTSSAGQYAGALLSLSEQSGAAEAVLDDLKLVNEIREATPNLSVFLKHPAVSAAEKKGLLADLLRGKIHELTANLLDLLVERRLIHLMPGIESRYEELLNEKKRITTGTLISAEPLDGAAFANIKSRLAQRLGGDLELELTIDRSLIGGYVLRLGDEVIDGSLKGRLQNIEKTLLAV